MDSIISKIEKKITSLGRGSIIFPDDFIDFGSNEAIRQSLTRLAKDGIIVRLAQGIYCYPEIETELGLGVILPSCEQVVQALSKRDKARIVPTGIYAQNILGLSTQVVMNYVYLTDGSARDIELSNGRSISFKNTAPKNLAFKNRLAMLITFALRSIKKENVNNEHINIITSLLQNETKEDVMSDLKLMPVWVRNIVQNAYK